jgi:adenosylcobinamide-GDP ribazoletransferase
VNGFRGATSFLTRVRMGVAVCDDAQLAAWVPWFPVVGAVVGLFVAIIYGLARWALPPAVAAATAVAAGALLTGAFHEDGLGDVADAFGGGRDHAEVLRILGDPRHGTYGVMAIASCLVLRVAALASLDPPAALAALPTAHALSRAAAVGLLGVMAPAAPGLGASYGAFVTRRRLALALGAGGAVGVAATGAWVAPMAAAAGLVTVTLAHTSARKLGGVTGDVAGATQQLVEAAVLLVAAAAVTHGHSLGPG